jgi:hypothetical protein
MKYMVAKRAQWNKMLKTKVQLSFSDKSYGPTGIEIGTLLPCFDGIIIGATLLSNSLTVSQMPIFTKVQELLKENVVSQGGEAPSSLRLQEQANLYFVELKKGTFIAVAEVKREGPLVKQGLYEVERLRAKRLRRLNPNQEAVLAHGLSTEWNDPWVQRLQRVRRSCQFLWHMLTFPRNTPSSFQERWLSRNISSIGPDGLVRTIHGSMLVRGRAQFQGNLLMSEKYVLS